MAGLFIKRFLILFLTSFLLVTVVLTSFFVVNRSVNRKSLEEHEQDHLMLMKNSTSGVVRQISSDLFIMSNSIRLAGYLESGNPEQKQKFSEECLLFSRGKGMYDQIRFLDDSGMEVIRINYNNGEPFIVAGEKLQFKGERYYFQDTNRL